MASSTAGKTAVIVIDCVFSMGMEFILINYHGGSTRGHYLGNHCFAAVINKY